MKLQNILLATGLCALSACSSMKQSHHASTAEAKQSQTVLINYHVKPGSEQELAVLLARVWEINRQHHLVYETPHVIIQGTEAGNKPRLVEIFTWVNHSAPDEVADQVKQYWGAESSLCESRNGHPEIEGGEVTLMLPAPAGGGHSGKH